MDKAKYEALTEAGVTPLRMDVSPLPATMFKDVTKLVEVAAQFYNATPRNDLVSPLEDWAAVTSPFDDGHSPQSYFAVDAVLVGALRALDQKVDLVSDIYIWARREVGEISDTFLKTLARQATINALKATPSNVYRIKA